MGTAATSVPQLSTRIAFAGLLLLLAALCVSTKVDAATICVQANDVFGLQTALNTAANNAEDDLIQLQAGEYDMGASFLLDYYPGAEQHDLTIEGGYGDFFGNPCGLAPAAPDARQTLLLGGELGLTLPDGAGSITLRGLTIGNMVGSNQPGWSIPVSIGGLANSTGSIFVYNAMFLSNGSVSNQAVFLIAPNGGVLLQNVLFAENASFANMSPISIGSFATGGNPCVIVMNSTFAQSSASRPAAEIRTQDCLSFLVNDIFCNNNGGDIAFLSPSMAMLANSDVQHVGDTANTQTSNILSVDPMFNPDLSLHDLSPLRELGNAGGFIFCRESSM